MSSTNAPLDVEFARTHLASQPFSVLLGARLVTFDVTSGAVLEIDARPDLLQQNGFLHGGVLAYAADNALTYAAGTVLGPAVLTGGMSIEYLRPAQGRTLRAIARVVHSGRRRAVCECTLEMVANDGSTSLCAVAQGTVLPVTAS
ncbi:PaaI family thioesterase [Rhodococcus xishaensis]|uniref:Medium/long-chain acyl-CoA thioesterase YigI n=1 Tax=Rhodococcus xishaensis TaxID=2487364 RepID=A0A3S3DVR5_9NOCA|nr:PaaI family thioesterase [Rhodococcus xishaensis]RVW00166.1 PaaI family thioesterase [Rhodococcus xishaensis]